ncbi:prepilin-type N-terminal cleavage/methylation domain-containing protein [bacterium]|nr:prepilin-type N-terminal cleavage/methylation domain-containing protein [bacterium]
MIYFFVKHMRKKAFTMVEILIVIFVF